MSTSIITSNNITYTAGLKTIIMGDLEISIPVQDTIEISSIAPNMTAHICLQKGDDIIFKTAMISAPVTPFEIIMYDQCGEISNKYPSNRIDNNSGTALITLENKILFSNIIFPLTVGQQYLVISDYPGLSKCMLQRSKSILVNNDLEKFSEKYDLRKIILFINEQLYLELSMLDIDLYKYFGDVHSVKSDCLIPYAVEYIAGASIAGSKTSFQGTLEFGDVDIEECRFCNQESFSSIVPEIRRKGIKINAEGPISKGSFIIIINNKGNDITEFIESHTGTIIKCLPFYDDDITSDHLLAFINAYIFYSNLKDTPSNSLHKFIIEHPLEVMQYERNSPICDILLIESETLIIKIFIEYTYIIHQYIIGILNDDRMITQRDYKFPNLAKRRMLGDNLHNISYCAMPKITRAITQAIPEQISNIIYSKQLF